MTLPDEKSHTHPNETDREQEYVSKLYARLDALREETASGLAAVQKESGGTPQARSERDAASARFSERLSRLEAAERGLCFGRLDLLSGTRHHVGRIGLPDESAEGDPLLIDWRAPAARPFYVATAAAPEGVHRRRHIVTRGRRVTGVDDEVLEGAADPGDALAGQAALLAAVDAARTGRMHDVVATLQAEQDAVIRADHRGVLVVQGGPGTGKTAVALHRAAFLLYDRPRIAAQGVLVVGPSSTFLTYIGQVLPGLGETGVLLSTVGELFPGVTAGRTESTAAAELKGRAAMQSVLEAAVRERQAPPGSRHFIEFDGEILHLDGELIRSASERARAAGLPHNRARRVFVREVTWCLAERLAERTRQLAAALEADVSDVLAEADVDRAVRGDLAGLEGVIGTAEPARAGEIVDEEDVAGLHRELCADPDLASALDELWPSLTPQRLLEELFADPRRLAAAAPDLSEAERALLVREPGGWSPADVPLLDEAAELLGADDRAARAHEEREHARQIAYAQGVLDIDAGSGRSLQGAEDAGDGDEGTLTARDLLDARRLAERHLPQDHSTLAEKAAADRTRTFGHVIVDEAQELSRMAWRLVMRRCPSRSMTLVGDVAQTGDAAGTSSWDRVLGPFVEDRWRLARLSVNYRTPAEIMDAAAGLLARLGPGAEQPRSVRRTGVRPWRRSTTAEELPGVLAGLAARGAAEAAGGRLAVIAPKAELAELARAVASRCPGASSGADPDLTADVVVLEVRQAKGLEFDSVLIADPAGILAGSPRGRNDLYVAMTRATQRLGILHVGEPPEELATSVREL